MPHADVLRQRRYAVALGQGVQRLERMREKLAKSDSRIASLRLAGSVALLAVVVGVWSRLDTSEHGLAVVGFFLFFLMSSLFHQKIQRRLSRVSATKKSVEMSLYRLRRESKGYTSLASPWHAGIAMSVPANHIYSSDLDIHSNLFDLLDTCSTSGGSRVLFESLIKEGVCPPAPSVRHLRVLCASMLRNRTPLLRKVESLRFEESLLAEQIKFEKNVDLREQENRAFESALSAKLLRYLYCAFGMVSWVVLLLPALGRFARDGNTEVLLSQLAFYVWVPILGVGIFFKVTESAKLLRRRAKSMSVILKLMTSLGDKAPWNDFAVVRDHAFNKLKQLERAVDFIELRGNPIFWLALHVLLPFDSIVTLFALHAMSRVANDFETWWAEVVEFDRLCAIARYARENSETSFLQDSPDDFHLFSFEELGHPLLPLEGRVNNSLSLSQSQTVTLLTGSNMSGKSTFLRSIGLNQLFLNMGAPVSAKRFLSPPRKILCAIRIDDSLEEATSYFYAEVKRLHEILKTLSDAQCGPALFLIDEIFRGTNNKERFVGSWHVIRALIATHAIGLVSTHDLALADLESKEPRLANKHFRERVEGEKLIFDYLLREGPCPTTNALRIMHIEGLPIPTELFAHENR